MGHRPSLGEQQLELLSFVADHAPISVSEVARQYGEPRGLARTTVLTVMENLRKKGYLTRARQEGAFHYTPRIAQSEVLRDLVRNFVEKTLGGSLSPFAAYLADAEGISTEEIAALRERLNELEALREATDDSA